VGKNHKRILLKEGYRIQTETSNHRLFQDTFAIAKEICSNGELAGYAFETEFYNGVTHDLSSVVVE
jgi:hypothetical protein